MYDNVGSNEIRRGVRFRVAKYSVAGGRVIRGERGAWSVGVRGQWECVVSGSAWSVGVRGQWE